ncbi:MAG TPA: hypothetical protein VI356_06425 [Myxococcales bacterium]
MIEECLAAARQRFGLRVIEFTVLGNHLHLIVEADGDEALSRGARPWAQEHRENRLWKAHPR